MIWIYFGILILTVCLMASSIDFSVICFMKIIKGLNGPSCSNVQISFQVYNGWAFLFIFIIMLVFTKRFGFPMLQIPKTFL